MSFKQSVSYKSSIKPLKNFKNANENRKNNKKIKLPHTEVKSIISCSAAQNKNNNISFTSLLKSGVSLITELLFFVFYMHNKRIFHKNYELF